MENNGIVVARISDLVGSEMDAFVVLGTANVSTKLNNFIRKHMSVVEVNKRKRISWKSLSFNSVLCEALNWVFTSIW